MEPNCLCRKSCGKCLEGMDDFSTKNSFFSKLEITFLEVNLDETEEWKTCNLDNPGKIFGFLCRQSDWVNFVTWVVKNKVRFLNHISAQVVYVHRAKTESNTSSQCEQFSFLFPWHQSFKIWFPCWERSKSSTHKRMFLIISKFVCHRVKDFSHRKSQFLKTLVRHVKKQLNASSSSYYDLTRFETT